MIFEYIRDQFNEYFEEHQPEEETKVAGRVDADAANAKTPAARPRPEHMTRVRQRSRAPRRELPPQLRPNIGAGDDRRRDPGAQTAACASEECEARGAAMWEKERLADGARGRATVETGRSLNFTSISARPRV